MSIARTDRITSEQLRSLEGALDEQALMDTEDIDLVILFDGDPTTHFDKYTQYCGGVKVVVWRALLWATVLVSLNGRYVECLAGEYLVYVSGRWEVVTSDGLRTFIESLSTNYTGLVRLFKNIRTLEPNKHGLLMNVPFTFLSENAMLAGGPGCALVCDHFGFVVVKPEDLKGYKIY